MAEQLDIARISAKLATLDKTLDDLDSSKEIRPFHDFLQKDVVPSLIEVFQIASTAIYHSGALAERVEEIEEGVLDSQLLPDDAKPIIEYLQESIAIFTRLSKDAQVPGVAKLAKKGEKILAFIESIVMEDDDDEGDDDDDDDDDKGTSH